jgi:hypothetical protein
VLPKVKLSTQVEFGDYPTNTFYVDPISKQIRGLTDGITAMKQAVEITLQVERYKFQIYSPNSGIEFEGLIGMDGDYITGELKRRIDDAFVPDSRILGTQDFVFAKTDMNTITVSFSVKTVFGNFTAEVNLNYD